MAGVFGMEVFMAGKMKFCIIADYFREEVGGLNIGGGERATDSLIQLLRQDHSVIARRAHSVSTQFIRDFDGRFIVSNRQNLSPENEEALFDKDYVLYEHDFAFLKGRDAGAYEDLKAPEDQIIHRELYEKAKKVVFQTKAHLHAGKVNLQLSNAVSSNGNPWDQKDLDFIRTLQKVGKIETYAILNHPYPTKGTANSVQFCQEQGWPYKILPALPHYEFLQELMKFRYLVFLPSIFETFSRVCAEAAMLNLDLILNQSVAFQYEEYSRLKGEDLINYFEDNNPKIVKLFTE